jgi:hypothetical protein
MLRKFILAVAVIVASAGPALAEGESCGELPIAPVLPTVAEIQQKAPAVALAAKHSAFEDVKHWQQDVKGYRDCLDALTNSEKRDLQNAQTATKPDKDKIKGIQDQMTQTAHNYDISVDAEERLVNEFHGVQVAFCGRTDVDRSSCPKT